MERLEKEMRAVQRSVFPGGSPTFFEGEIAPDNTPGERSRTNAPVIDLTKEETGKGYRFEIAGSKDKQFFVRFVAANGEPMVRSETYTRRASALKCINSLKTRAAAAETVEEL